VIPVTRKPLRRAASLATPALALAALLCGCSDNPDVLAKVDGETITVAEFNEAAGGALQQYSGPPDSVKIHLLKDLVDRELLVQGAVRAGLKDTPEFQALQHQIERQTLREELIKRLMGGPFPVSDAEVRELYQRQGTVTRARVIYTFDEGVARQAASDLQRGENFATVADRYNPPGMVPPGGDVGMVVPGALLPPLDDLVRTGALGKVLGPVAGGDGWFLLRLEERKTQKQPPFEQVQTQLAEMLRQRKQRVSGQKAVESLKADYQMAVEKGAPQVFVERFRQAPGAANTPDPAPGAAPMPSLPAPPTPEERKRVLARYRGGEYTLGEAYDDLKSPGASRPNLSVLPTVQRWIEAQTLERAAYAEALKRHLGDEPAVKQRIRERLNNVLLDAYYQRAVLTQVQVGPADVEAAYERHKGSFSRLQSARVATVTMSDSAGAAALAEQAGHAPSLREAAATAAAGGRVREERLKFPASSPLWTQFEGRLMTMSANEIAGPYKVPGGWFIVQLIEKQQDSPPFASLPEGAKIQLQGAATEMKREARLTALTDSLRTAFKPQLHPERLARVPWPPPASPQGT
jgi:peptidyl-prolyl cis-trans isomerase C